MKLSNREDEYCREILSVYFREGIRSSKVEDVSAK